MCIAYVSADEVNRDLATRMVAAFGKTVQPLLPEDPCPEGRFDAVVYDLESLDPKVRKETLTRLHAHPATCPVAVHAYDLDAEADSLRGNGVVVVRRLRPSVFRILGRLAKPAVSRQVRHDGGKQRRGPLGSVITVSTLGLANAL